MKIVLIWLPFIASQSVASQDPRTTTPEPSGFPTVAVPQPMIPMPLPTRVGEYPFIEREAGPTNGVTFNVVDVRNTVDTEHCAEATNASAIMAALSPAARAAVRAQVERYVARHRAFIQPGGHYGTLSVHMSQEIDAERFTRWVLVYSCLKRQGATDVEGFRLALYAELPSMRSEIERDRRQIEQRLARTIGPLTYTVRYNGFRMRFEAGVDYRSRLSFDRALALWHPTQNNLGDYVICKWSIRETIGHSGTAHRIEPAEWDASSGPHDFRSLRLNVYAEGNHRTARQLALENLEVSYVQAGLSSSERIALGCDALNFAPPLPPLTLADAWRIRGDTPRPPTPRVPSAPNPAVVTHEPQGIRLSFTIRNVGRTQNRTLWRCWVVDTMFGREVPEGEGIVTLQPNTTVTDNVSCHNSHADGRTWRFHYEPAG